MEKMNLSKQRAKTIADDYDAIGYVILDHLKKAMKAVGVKMNATDLCLIDEPLDRIMRKKYSADYAKWRKTQSK